MLTGWLFASSCSPPRLSATQFLSATKGQLPLRSGLSPNCCCVLVGALAALSPAPGLPRPWGHGRYSCRRQSVCETPVLRVSLQDVRDIAAKRNNSQIFPARDLEPKKHDLFGEAVASKLRRHLRVRKQDSVAVPPIFGDRELPADLHFEAALGFVIDYRRGWNLLRHRELK